MPDDPKSRPGRPETTPRPAHRDRRTAGEVNGSCRWLATFRRFLPFRNRFPEKLERIRLDDNWTKKQRGDLGEDLAAEYLVKMKRFRLLTRNWRHGRDEIDLVCRHRDNLVFVEVKTRTGGGLVPGYFAVNRDKKKALLRVCRAYMKELRIKPRTFRFDVVEVVLWRDREAEINHFETVRLFPKDLRYPV